MMNQVPRPKRWELILVHKDPDSFGPLSYTKIEDDDLVSLMAQFQVTIAMEMRHYYEKITEEIKEKYRNDDDIPF